MTDLTHGRCASPDCDACDGGGGGAVTGDLVERLRSALDEAERIAKATTCAVPWRVVNVSHLVADVQGECEGWVTAAPEGACSLEDATFIAANDPAHVLRTVRAHRKILELHCRVDSREDWVGARSDDWPPNAACYGCHADFNEEWAVPDIKDCPIVADLVSIYFPEDTPNEQ